MLELNRQKIDQVKEKHSEMLSKLEERKIQQQMEIKMKQREKELFKERVFQNMWLMEEEKERIWVEKQIQEQEKEQKLKMEKDKAVRESNKRAEEQD